MYAHPFKAIICIIPIILSIVNALKIVTDTYKCSCCHRWKLHCHMHRTWHDVECTDFSWVCPTCIILLEKL